MGGSNKLRGYTALGGFKSFKNDHSMGSRLKGPAARMNRAYDFAEDSMMSYDDLVASGRIKAGEDYYGLKGGESRVSRLVDSYQDSLSAADPVFAKYRQLTQQRLEGLESGIPDDLRRSITESLRDTQARRGIMDSNVGAIEETIRLMGGQEAITSQRLSEAQAYFNQVTMPAFAQFMPGLDRFLGTEYQTNLYNMNREVAGANIQNQRIGMGLDVAGSIIGGAIGASDIKVKKNIQFINEQNGVRVYRFNYDTDKYPELPEGEFVGVMAHEVAHIKGAVIKGDRYDYVNYDVVNRHLVAS